MSWNQGQVVHMAVVADEDDMRLDRWLKRKFPGLAQGQVERLLRRGEIRVDGARAKANQRLAAGATVRVPPIAPRADEDERPKPQAVKVGSADAAWIRSLVIFEDDRIVALNKPAGVAVQGGTGTRRHIDGLSRALVGPEDEKPRLVHRLDRDTTGVLVLAKSAGAAAELGRVFRSRELQKVYWAVTLGAPQPASAELRGWMIKSEGPGGEKEKMRAAAHGEKGAVHAVTQYEVIANAGQLAAWVALRPVTGRTHQLRFHMAEIGCAILGDAKYTCGREAPGGVGSGLHLHARALRLPGKGGAGREVEIIADLPDHMNATFAELGFDPSAGRRPFAPFEESRRRRT